MKQQHEQPVKKLEQRQKFDLPVLDSSRDISAERQLDLFSVQPSYINGILCPDVAVHPLPYTAC
jgi:hypothetical protein